MSAKVGSDWDGDSMQRELECLARVTAQAGFSAINVPKLLGLFETTPDGKVIGILEELVPAADSQAPATLAMIGDMGAIPRRRREAWAAQVQQTVSRLHGMGVIWGDAKADNVLIHAETDEA